MSRAPRILYDCDTGIDDAMTLLYLASLVRAGEAELAGVGTVHGNIDPMTGALNTLRVLEAAGVKAGEQGVPVAVGAARPMAQDVHYALDWHGTDGLGDTHLAEPAGRPVAEQAAAQIVRMAREAPGELTLLATGPLTNLGAALLLDDALPSLIREVVVMGGAFDHPGNITTHAEANIWHDPEAADLVFAADWPVVLVPLDATHPTAVHDDWLDRLAAHGTPVTRFAASILEFYADAYTPTLRRRGAVIHDALAAMLVVDPDLGEYAHRPVRVELRGELTRGTTVWDARSLPAEDTRRPVKVAVGSDVEAFKERLLAALTSF
ncbi:nucleoside hydrolase [Actinomadura madurae]|uniref:Inosine-uridine preferring nucleoside hydrolase n=1 Tax=Actinomadura madurae TaxID=1993 RepID=A0A1I5SZB7_9ACTN|nr:nucleoside hydrolase [Actinomadura madurae]SFP76103.1 Inosine-uridine preferring nucleoside hydrolase [Actinomadura madurae]SPT59669.1 Pyrimidine-specific ribonucleoside hydrolase rihA [Actinomadura madurae]